MTSLFENYPKANKDIEKCKDCEYRHVFYMGTEKEPKFSVPACHWAWRYCEDVKPIECHFKAKHR